MLLWCRAISIRKSFSLTCPASLYLIPIFTFSFVAVYHHCSDIISNSQPTESPGLVDSFVCNCSDCHKITASMFASNFIVDDTYLKHLRGRENLKTFSQARTIASGNTMTNYFCSTCGTLMYRVSSGLPGRSIPRIGTIDDFHLHETKLKPRVEQFTKDRVGWLCGLDGVRQVEGSAY